MIQFRDKNNNVVIDAIYFTQINKQTLKANLQYKIKYISPEFNGEYLYIIDDDIGEQVMMYRFDLKDEFEDFNLFFSANNPEQIYTNIGSFFEILKICTMQYNKEVARQEKSSLTKDILVQDKISK